MLRCWLTKVSHVPTPQSAQRFIDARFGVAQLISFQRSIDWLNCITNCNDTFLSHRCNVTRRLYLNADDADISDRSIKDDLKIRPYLRYLRLSSSLNQNEPPTTQTISALGNSSLISPATCHPSPYRPKLYWHQGATGTKWRYRRLAKPLGRRTAKRHHSYARSHRSGRSMSGEV